MESDSTGTALFGVRKLPLVVVRFLLRFFLSSGNQLGWLRLPSNDTFLNQIGDPSAGPRSPHMEILFGVRAIYV